MAPGSDFEEAPQQSALTGASHAGSQGHLTPGGAHPLASLSPTASLFSGQSASGSAAAHSGGDPHVVSTDNAVHPAKAKGPDGQPVIQDRAWVESHRKQLGMPADMPAEQFFHEFLAHEMAYKESTKQVAVDPKDASKGMRTEDNYTPYEHQMLKAWGYSDKPQEVQDKASGLYAARFNPLDQGKDGPAPVVAFRGTADLPGVRADADKYIGASQYEPHKAEIGALMNADHGRVVTTGHSLGGSLAQKAAADNVANVSGVTTFQSPGISGSDAKKFNKGNADGHATVGHHYVSSDTVHRAGDQKLGGKFFENRVDGMDGAMSAPGLTLANVMPSHTGYMYYSKPGGENLRDPTNKWAKNGQAHVTTEEHDKDTVGSRHFHEGLRQGAGTLVTGGLAAVGAAKDLGHGFATGARDTAHDLGQTGQKAKQGLADAASESWQGAKTAGSGLKQGGSEILHGNFRAGLGDAGRGLAHGTGQLLHGGVDSLATVGKAAGGTAMALGHGVVDVGAGALHAGGDLLRGGGTMAYQTAKSAQHLAQVPGEFGAWAGHKAVDAGTAAVHAGGRAARATGHAVSNGAHWAGDKAKGALHAIGL